MEKGRKNRKYSGNWKKQKNNESRFQKQHSGRQRAFRYNSTLYENPEAEKERLRAIQELKSRSLVCPVCGEPLTDVAGAMTDRESGAPAHFDCIIRKIGSAESLGDNEKIAYIGQGRFGILYFENPRDQRHFKIRKIIEWEPRDARGEWRDELSSLYSQIR